MRYLFGPLWGAIPSGFLSEERQSGACRLFGEGPVDIAVSPKSADLSWQQLVSSIPANEQPALSPFAPRKSAFSAESQPFAERKATMPEQPDVLMLWLATPLIPEALWKAPIPIV